jgi:hypothetical protein
MRWSAGGDTVKALKTDYTEIKRALIYIAEKAVKKLRQNHELKSVRNMILPFPLSREINCFRD